MANTVIALKKSATPSSVPSNLANGELAINYADGKLYYKAANGTIAAISGNEPNYFGTVNANNTLVVADTPGDVFTLATGNNIAITGDAINDRITVALTNDVNIPGKVNVGGNFAHTGGDFFINNSSGAGGSDEGGEIKLANSTGTQVLSGPISIDIYQNKLRFFETNSPNRGAFINIAACGTTVGTDLLSSSGTTDSVARATAGQAFDKANAALPNVSGVSFNGNLTVSQNLTSDRVFTNNNGNGENLKIGDDAWIGDTNLANAFRIKGQQNASIGYIIFGPNDGKLLGRDGTGPLTYDGGTVWHSNNDGAGSGLDADLLDGQHGSYYGIATDVTAANRVANAAFLHANAAFASSNADYAFSNSAHTIANLAFAHANAAFAVANAALPLTGGTISGNLVVTGNATFSGLTTYANTQTLLIGDNVLVLNADLPAAAAPSENSGITVNRGSSANADLIWNEGTDQWTISEGDGIYRNIASNTDIEGVTATAVAAFAVANTSGNEAEAAFLRANLAHAHANAAFLTANTALPNTSGTIFNGQLFIPTLLAGSAATDIARLRVVSSGNITYIQSGTQVTNSGRPIHFAKYSSTGAVFMIDIANNTVAIGRTDPVYAFDVVGTANASNILVNGNMVFTAANDGSGSNLDADLLDGQQGTYYGIATDVAGAFAQANTARVHANTAHASANAGLLQANTARDHANAAFAKANTGTPAVISLDTRNVTNYIVFEDSTSGTFANANVSTSLTYNPSTGTLSSTLFNSTSDINKKENIVQVIDALNILDQIDGVRFTWKNNGLPSLGVIAQQVEKVLPEIVEREKSVNYNGLIAVLIEAVKELKSEIEELKKNR